MEWVAVPFSRGSSQPRDRTQVSLIAGRFFISWATREVPCFLWWILNWKPGQKLEMLSLINQVLAILVQLLFSRSFVSNSLRPHGLQHDRLPCPSPSARVCPNSCPLSWWCHPTISSSVTPFFCLQSFPASGSFTLSQLFASGGQNIGVSALASVLLMNIQGWFPLELTCLISLLSKELSRVFLSFTIRKCEFFGPQASLWSNSHFCTWLLEKP